MSIADVFLKKFETYRRVLDSSGEQAAWDTLFRGYPERQKVNMGKAIEGCTLAEGFSKGVERYKQIGMDMAVIDLSNEKTDAVLEIQRTCPALSQNMHGRFGFDKPCHVICEMDIAATEAAFPGMKGKILCRMADGDCACLFKYERPPLKR